MSSVDMPWENGKSLRKRLDTAMAELQQTPFGQKLLELWEKRPKPGDDFVAYRYEQDEELIAFAKEALDAAGDGQVWDLCESMIEAFRQFEIEVVKVYKKMHLEELGKDDGNGNPSSHMLAWMGSDIGLLCQFHLFQQKILPFVSERGWTNPAAPIAEQTRTSNVAEAICEQVYEMLYPPSGIDLDEFA